MQTLAVELETYEKIKKKLGLEETQALLKFVELSTEKSTSALVKDLATKMDVSELKTELKTDIGNLKEEFKTDIGNLKEELKTDMSNLELKLAHIESKLIKWMFIFWVSSIGTLIGVFKLAGIF